MKADWLVEGGRAIISQHHSLYLFRCLSPDFSLSFCFLIPFLPFLCLMKEKAEEEGANVRETRECVERERGKKGQDSMDQAHSPF